MHALIANTLRHAEVFRREDDGVVKGSIVNSTRATYSLANRAFFFEGLLVQNPAWPKKPEGFKPVAVGEYLTRENDGFQYVVETLQPAKPTSQGNPGQSYCFLAMGNTRVTLARPKGKESGPDDFVVYARDVLIFLDTTVRSFKAQNDGLLSQDITVVHIPARHKVQKMDRLYILKDGVPLEKCEVFRVDSINDSLTVADDKVDTSGVNIMQLTVDNYPGQPDGGGGTGPGAEGGW